MTFNSVSFLIFFVIVYGLYLALNHKWQNRMLLLASYIFYGSWDWRFLGLLFLSTTVDFFCAKRIHGTGNEKKRKFFLVLSVAVNLGILGFFKYFNFFASGFEELLNGFGFHPNRVTLNIVLPVGISFYTFQSLSYTIDVYRGVTKPANQLSDYALFVAFFPQLVAGPIERSSTLLPQILAPRKLRLDDFYEGCFLVLWGLYEKMFVADNLARVVDIVFSSHAPYDGILVLCAIYAFAFQIFCDFDGYSNIARGLGKLMGFEIMTNFNLPYFAANPAQFWRRWHISLSQWLKDYLYVPLGGNRKGFFVTLRNIAVTLLLGGLWHGARLNFLFWGAYHGMLLGFYRAKERFFTGRFSQKNNWDLFIRAAKIIFLFHLVSFGWLIFRAESVRQISQMVSALLGVRLLNGAELLRSIRILCREVVPFVFFLVILQVAQYRKNDLLILLKLKPAYQMAAFLIMIYSLILLGVTSSEPFIYFQF